MATMMPVTWLLRQTAPTCLFDYILHFAEMWGICAKTSYPFTETNSSEVATLADPNVTLVRIFPTFNYHVDWSSILFNLCIQHLQYHDVLQGFLSHRALVDGEEPTPAKLSSRFCESCFAAVQSRAGGKGTCPEQGGACDGYRILWIVRGLYIIKRLYYKLCELSRGADYTRIRISKSFIISAVVAQCGYRDPVISRN